MGTSCRDCSTKARFILGYKIQELHRPRPEVYPCYFPNRVRKAKVVLQRYGDTLLMSIL